MEHSIKVVIDGITIVECEDTDAEAIAGALEALAQTSESIRRFGLKATLRALCKRLGLREALFVEAKAGNPHLSTVVIG